MISNEKMEEYWMRYQSEGVAKGLSMQAFCSLNNIPYNAFEKYLTLRRHFSTACPVKITDLPEERIDDAKETGLLPEESAKPITSTAANCHKQTGVRIMVDIRMTNGINIRQKNLSYAGLHSLVEKIETLC